MITMTTIPPPFLPPPLLPPPLPPPNPSKNKRHPTLVKNQYLFKIYQMEKKSILFELPKESIWDKDSLISRKDKRAGEYVRSYGFRAYDVRDTTNYDLKWYNHEDLVCFRPAAQLVQGIQLVPVNVPED